LELDAGDVLAREVIPLSGRETAEVLSGIVAERGAALVAALLREAAVSGVLPAGRPQTGEAVYCSLISKDDGRINWAESAVTIDRRIRAYTPWPLCVTGQGGAELFILAGRPCAGAVPVVPAAAPDAVPPGAAPGTVVGVDKKQGILIQTGDGIFAAERLQYRAKKALDWKSFLNGAQNFLGSHLG
jgi:methionyl-tRNA formyltransferase